MSYLDEEEAFLLNRSGTFDAPSAQSSSSSSSSSHLSSTPQHARLLSPSIPLQSSSPQFFESEYAPAGSSQVQKEAKENKQVQPSSTASLWDAPFPRIPPSELARQDAKEHVHVSEIERARAYGSFPELKAILFVAQFWHSPSIPFAFQFIFSALLFTVSVSSNVSGLSCFHDSSTNSVNGLMIFRGTNIISLTVVFLCFFFARHFLKQDHLYDLLMLNEQIYSHFTTRKIIRSYVGVGLVLSLVFGMTSAAGMTEYRSLYDQDSCGSPSSFLGLISASKIAYFLIVCTSMVLYAIVCHLSIREIDRYTHEMRTGAFASVREAMLRHLAIVQRLDRTNKHWEPYCAGCLALFVLEILGNMYGLLTASGQILHYLCNFLAFSSLLLASLLPGAIVTRRCRHVLKAANRIRAHGAEEHSQSMDAFLLYLGSSNSGWKTGGVLVSIGFTTKTLLAVFTVLAFVVQRATAPSSK